MIAWELARTAHKEYFLSAATLAAGCDDSARRRGPGPRRGGLRWPRAARPALRPPARPCIPAGRRACARAEQHHYGTSTTNWIRDGKKPPRGEKAQLGTPVRNAKRAADDPALDGKLSKTPRPSAAAFWHKRPWRNATRYKVKTDDAELAADKGRNDSYASDDAIQKQLHALDFARSRVGTTSFTKTMEKGRGPSEKVNIGHRLSRAEAAGRSCLR